jgi:transcriptional regulator with XRE-family HTH domain
MTPAQCRAARALLGMNQSVLALAASVGLSTVVDFEKKRRLVSQDAVKAMRSALERQGIVFSRSGVGFREFSGLREETTIFHDSTHMDYTINKIGFLSSAQIRAARALLKWSAQDLARESALGVNTIRRAEVADEGISLTVANHLAIRRALEAAGVVFIDENGGGPGVRLRERLKGKSRRR